ncbi:glycosyltransferase [Microbacterium sp. NPDC055683]
MRILHVIPSYARRDGGPSEVIRGLLPAQVQLGHDVSLLSTDRGLEREDRFVADGIHVDLARARAPRMLNFATGMLPLLRRGIAQADVVHIHSVNSYPTTLAMALARRHGVPYLLEPHGALDEFHRREGRLKKAVYTALFDRRGLAQMSGAIVSSDRERAETARVWNAPICDMPLGVDDALFELEPRRAEVPVILFLGRIAAKKRLDLLLRALASDSMHGVRWRAIVAGPTDDDIDYRPEELAAELGLSDRVEFRGRVNAAERADLLASADLFVLPSHDESFGMAVAEAMAARVAVLTTRHVGIAPAAASTGSLIMIEADPRSIASELERCLRDERYRTDVATRGRSYASATFRWDQAARRSLEAYELAVRAGAVL